MKKKLFFICVLMAAASVIASAQLTTGTPSAKTIRTGNRPGAGDWGLYLGVPLNRLANVKQFHEQSLVPFPVINVKYYASDHLELRASLDAYASTTAFSGKEKTSEEKLGQKTSTSQFLLKPGLAYHFTKKSILDVYMGAEVLLGTNGTGMKTVNAAADLKMSQKSNCFSTGLGAFIGLQAFIANLPLAVGVEYGLASQFDLGLKTRTAVNTAGTTEVTYDTELLDGTDFKHVTARRGEIGQLVCITLSYYFK